tara:strand:- start:221 stop:784 length:564 start_codon:yes stop_codon:yes gene_type:complete
MVATIRRGPESTARPATRNMTNELTRQFFPIEAVRSREAGTPLGELYEFWHGLQRVKEGALPRDFEFLPATKVGRAMDFMIAMDVSADDPAAYRTLSVGERAGIYPSCVPGAAIGAPKAADEGDLLIDLLWCKANREPFYCEAEYLIGDRVRHIVTLLLPVTDEAGNIERIYAAFRLVGAPARTRVE